MYRWVINKEKYPREAYLLIEHARRVVDIQPDFQILDNGFTEDKNSVFSFVSAIDRRYIDFFLIGDEVCVRIGKLQENENTPKIDDERTYFWELDIFPYITKIGELLTDMGERVE